MEINLSIDPDLVRKILTEFIRSEITRPGFSHAVVNLSGGVDSAVSFVLSVEAMGPKNVLAIRCPYKTSSPDSLEHAQILIDQFGCPSVTIPITDMTDALISLEPGMPDIRKGNIMARARMIVAYDQSEAFKGLVIGTGNKTEILLGYTTLYGDFGLRDQPDRRPLQDAGTSTGASAGNPGSNHRQASLSRPVDRSDRRGRARVYLCGSGQTALPAR